MPLRLPVRRFIQSADKTQPPGKRYGAVQWVLARSLYRFQVFDLGAVPLKNRSQALQLELRQWTPFSNPGYYIGWSGNKALVWAWDAEKAGASTAAAGLNPFRVLTLPETVLHTPLHSGACLVRCVEGFEGQLWRSGKLQHSRWWPQSPAAGEWLTFQRDAGLAPDEQLSAVPAPRSMALTDRAWVAASDITGSDAFMSERLAYAGMALALLLPTLWFSTQWYRLQTVTSELAEQKQTLQEQATPIAEARSQALEHQSRSVALAQLAPFPGQLSLLAKVAQTLPQDKSFIKDWDFQNGQLKFTLSSLSDISATNTINLLQQAGPFKDVKALPGRDSKNVTFQMTVMENPA